MITLQRTTHLGIPGAYTIDMFVCFAKLTYYLHGHLIGETGLGETGIGEMGVIR